jgi:hypothetical protein
VGKRNIALELSLEMEKKPRTPLTLLAVFQDFSARFVKCDGVAGAGSDQFISFDSISAIQAAQATADLVNRMGAAFSWRQFGFGGHSDFRSCSWFAPTLD